MSSPVWKFFKVAEEDNAIAICNTCSAKVPRGGKKSSSFNTTNLISHLKLRHREDVFKEYETLVADERKRKATNVTVVPKARAVPIQQAFENSKKFARDNPKATAINDKIMEFMVLDY